MNVASDVRFLATLALEVFFATVLAMRYVRTARRRMLVGVGVAVLVGLELAVFDVVAGFGPPRTFAKSTGVWPTRVHYFEARSPWLGWLRLRVVLLEDPWVLATPGKQAMKPAKIELREDGWAVVVTPATRALPARALSGIDRIFLIEHTGDEITESHAAVFEPLWRVRGDDAPDVYTDLRVKHRASLDAPLRRFLDLAEKD